MNSRLQLVLISGLAMLAGADAQAGFYRWTDAGGQLRVSNIPPQGVAADGSVLPRYNPLSIAAQQARLRLRLEARDAQIRREQELQSPPAAELDEARTK